MWGPVSERRDVGWGLCPGGRRWPGSGKDALLSLDGALPLVPCPGLEVGAPGWLEVQAWSLVLRETSREPGDRYGCRVAWVAVAGMGPQRQRCGLTRVLSVSAGFSELGSRRPDVQVLSLSTGSLFFLVSQSPPAVCT